MGPERKHLSVPHSIFYIIYFQSEVKICGLWMTSGWAFSKYILLQWAEAIESLDDGVLGSDKSFGMKQRPDGDIEIDEKYWEHDFCIPTCQKCNGVLKPDVRLFLPLFDNISCHRSQITVLGNKFFPWLFAKSED